MTSLPRRASRYQRRILAWGGGLACLLYVGGAPVFLDRVESDLVERVTTELADAGYDGFTVSFSGQTGSIDCTRPLSDPQDALDVAYEVRGVHDMDDLPDACRVRTASSDAEGADAEGADAEGADDEGADGEGAVGEPVEVTTTTLGGQLEDIVPSTSTTTTTIASDFASVADIVGGNPQFSLLAQLVEDAGLTPVLAGDGPVTLFAPTDAAFDALPADAVAQLRSDPDLLERVLGHHLVGERVLLEDLRTGTLTTLAGDDLDVDAGALTVDGAAITEPDVLAANGVLHSIDRILLPDDVDLSPVQPLASAAGTYADGGFVLQGIVRSEVERTILVDAATFVTGPARVVDELTVDPTTGLDEDTATGLARLLAAMPDALLSGDAGFDGEMLYVSGIHTGEAQRDALLAVAAEVGAEADLAEPPAATEDDAVDLEAELNEYVAANPILFEPNSSVLDATAVPVLDEIARRAREFSGVSITVEGHTDSDGSAQQNLVLSQLRAVAVQGALIERGLEPESVTAEGFGSTQPILVDGVEDKAASRRVEFRVVVS